MIISQDTFLVNASKQKLLLLNIYVLFYVNILQIVQISGWFLIKVENCSDPEVCNLFKEFGYIVLPTGGDASHQNGPVEHAHRTISQSVEAVLIRAGLDVKFWPYVFHHVI